MGYVRRLWNGVYDRKFILGEYLKINNLCSIEEERVMNEKII